MQPGDWQKAAKSYLRRWFSQAAASENSRQSVSIERSDLNAVIAARHRSSVFFNLVQ